MSALQDIPTVTFSSGKDLLRVALAANQVVLLIGDPGVGKSSICADIATELKLPLHTLLGSTLDPTDIGGLPMRAAEGDRMLRIPLDEIYQCAARPGILFLDEISTPPAAVQATLLRLILDRVAGNVRLHPDTRILAACNPAEQCPSGIDLSAALIGRLTVAQFRPTDSEILAYLRQLGSNSDQASDFDRALREEAATFCAVASATPELLQIEIPKVCINGGQPWASPRSCERMIRALAAASALGLDKSSHAVFAAMAGSIGERAATVYLGVQQLMGALPSVEEIVLNPDGVVAPADKTKQVAALGLMPRIAVKNLWAAYIYAARLSPEFALAAHQCLLGFTDRQPPPSDKLTKAGVLARAKISATLGAPLSASRK